jgi:predicted RNase H-like HicB family nuclease
MRELIFEVIQKADGGYCAECLTETIVTAGNTSEELRQNVREVVKAFYFDEPDRLPATSDCIWFEMKCSLTREIATESQRQ